MYKLRKPTNADLPFIVNAWLKSYRTAEPGATNTVYFHEQKALILRLLNEQETLLAVDPEDPEHILGFVCWDPAKGGPDSWPTLHYVYVKFALRRNGLARELLHAAGLRSPFYFSHLAKPTGLRIVSEHPGQLIFNPWRAR